MGITDPAQPTEENVGGRPIPAGVDSVPDPEITQEQLDLTNDFVRFLAPPTPARLDATGRRGRELFSQIGCAACHIPTLRTGDSPVAALRHREFAAYTDLLLHDMGPDLADICLGRATPSQFRTEPLIDLRDAQRFLHDGRATTPEQAIEAHGDRKSTRLNSSHGYISYAVFCLKKKKKNDERLSRTTNYSARHVHGIRRKISTHK